MKLTNNARHAPFRFIFAAVIAAGMAPDLRGNSFSNGLERLSVDELDKRSILLQNRLDSLNAVREGLRQDSAEAMVELSIRNSASAEKRTEAADAFATKQKLIEETKRRYEKARMDSIAITTEFRKQITKLHDEIASLETAVSARSNELITVSGRHEKERSAQDENEERTIGKQNRQIALHDSIIGVRQTALSTLKSQRERLIRDSLHAEATLTSEEKQYSGQISRLDSMIAANDAVIEATERKRADERSEKERTLSRLKSDIERMRKLRSTIDGRISVLNTGVTNLSAERKRLDRSSGAVQSRYDKLYAPIKENLTEKENAFKRISKEKPVLLALRQKLRLDSAIAKAREALDDAVQMKAKKKRGAKKLVTQREAELDSLVAKQDMIVRGTAGVREKADQIRGPTLARTTAMVDSAIAGFDNRLTSAAIALDKARREALNFEEKHPLPKNPAARRIAVIDSLCVNGKKDIIQLTERSDSLGVQMKASRSAIAALASASPSATGAIGPEVAARKSERAVMSAERSKLRLDSARAGTAAAAELRRIKNELASTLRRETALHNDISLSTAERDNVKASLAAIMDMQKRKSASQIAEKAKTDSTVRAKQKDITMLSMRADKLRNDSIAITTHNIQQIAGMNPSPSSLALQLADLTKEALALQVQSDSLKKRTRNADGHTAEEARKFSLQIAGISHQIESVTKDIASLASSRQNAYSRLKKDKIHYDSLVGAIEQELAETLLRRDKARGDSAEAETAIQRVSQTTADGGMKDDETVASLKKELADQLADYSRKRDDSIQTAAQIPPTLQQYRQVNETINALIAAKEKEIIELRMKREKNRQDSSAEHKRRRQLLASAHTEIMQRLTDMERKENELSLVMSGKKKTRRDPGSARRKIQESLMTATMEIQRLTDLAATKRTALARARKELDAITSGINLSSWESISAAGPNATASTQAASLARAPVAPLAPSVSGGTVPEQASNAPEIAQKRSEEIYGLLGENRVSEAATLFKQLKRFLEINLNPEVFQTLKISIEQTGGG